MIRLTISQTSSRKISKKVYSKSLDETFPTVFLARDCEKKKIEQKTKNLPLELIQTLKPLVWLKMFFYSELKKNKQTYTLSITWKTIIFDNTY